MIDDALFVSGAQRSGTTLLAKLLDAQPAVSILSQPFPLLFVEAKRAFLRSIGAGDEAYPLGHLFAETRYDGAQLARFLRGWRIEREDLARIFAQMSGYSGQYTKFTTEEVAHLRPDGDFAAVVSDLQHALSRAHQSRWFGSKETSCEELLPYLLSRGFRCVLIVRDPRDMVASLNHGRGPEFGGAHKPTWFNVRSWRKSVAHALALEGMPRFHWCRYEDLAADPVHSLGRIFNALEIDAPAHFKLVGAGNSSYGEREGIHETSVGVYREVLPGEVAHAIEAATLPELRVLGYETSLTKADATRAIESFREPYEMTRSGMERDAANAANASLEIERLERISRRPGPESIPWFLFERVHARLREART